MHRYIENFGFYEGGDANEYRVDPEVLVGLLTGRVDDSLLQVVRRRRMAKLAVRERELRQMHAQEHELLAEIAQQSVSEEGMYINITPLLLISSIRNILLLPFTPF